MIQRRISVCTMMIMIMAMMMIMAIMMIMMRTRCVQACENCVKGWTVF